MSTFALAYEAKRRERAQTASMRASRRPKEKARYNSNPKRRALDRIKTERGCQRCEVKGLPPAAYDFHHRDRSEKLFNLASSMAAGRSWDLIRAEIEKCDVLCATCHRIVEHEAHQMSS